MQTFWRTENGQRLIVRVVLLVSAAASAFAISTADVSAAPTPLQPPLGNYFPVSTMNRSGDYAIAWSAALTDHLFAYLGNANSELPTATEIITPGIEGPPLVGVSEDGTRFVGWENLARGEKPFGLSFGLATFAPGETSPVVSTVQSPPIEYVASPVELFVGAHGEAILLWVGAAHHQDFLFSSTQPAGGSLGPATVVAATSTETAPDAPQAQFDGDGNPTVGWSRNVGRCIYPRQPQKRKCRNFKPLAQYSVGDLLGHFGPATLIPGSNGCGLSELQELASGAALASLACQQKHGDDLRASMRPAGGEFLPAVTYSNPRFRFAKAASTLLMPDRSIFATWTQGNWSATKRDPERLLERTMISRSTDFGVFSPPRAMSGVIHDTQYPEGIAARANLRFGTGGRPYLAGSITHDNRLRIASLRDDLTTGPSIRLSWEGPFAIADSGVGMILDTESVRNGNDIADLATLDKFTAPQP